MDSLTHQIQTAAQAPGEADRSLCRLTVKMRRIVRNCHADCLQLRVDAKIEAYSATETSPAIIDGRNLYLRGRESNGMAFKSNKLAGFMYGFLRR